MLERTATLSEIVASGIAGRDPEFNALASGPGKTVDLPFWKDLTGASEVLSDSASLTPDKITSGQDTASVQVSLALSSSKRKGHLPLFPFSALTHGPDT